MHADEHASRMSARPAVPVRGTGERRHRQVRQMRVPRPVVTPQGRPPIPRQLARCLFYACPERR